MKKILGLPVKWFVIILLVLLIGLGLLFDFIWARTYKIEVLSIDPPHPYCSAIDEVEEVHITLRLSQFGKEKSGHKLVATATVDGASVGYFYQNVVKTDENGQAVFIYYVYSATSTSVPDVDIFVFDEDNSVIFEINATVEFVLPVQAREGM